MKQVVLKRELTSKPEASDFELIETATPECPEGGILVDVKYISLDPYVGHLLHKGHMGQAKPEPGKGLIPGAIVGEVINHPEWGFGFMDAYLKDAVAAVEKALN